MSEVRYKISGSGYLCAWCAKLRTWIPVFQLTEMQTKQLRSVLPLVQ